MTTPLAAGKAAERAGKALTGDIWTRTTTREVGRGRNKRLVESTVRVNPVGVGLGTAALGVAAVGAAVTLWAMQMRVAPVTETTDVSASVYFTEGRITKTLKADAPPKPLRTDYADGALGDIAYATAVAIWEVSAYTITQVADPYVTVGLKRYTVPQFTADTVAIVAPKLKDASITAGALPSNVYSYTLSPVTTKVVYTATGTTSRFALKERRGFSVLGGDQPLPEVTDVARTVAPAFVSPIAVLIDLLRR